MFMVTILIMVVSETVLLVTGGSHYSDSRYSDISKWVMQWVRIRVRARDRAKERVRVRVSVSVRVKVTVRVRVSVSCAFPEAFVGLAVIGIAAVGIAACTR